jgi:glycosyltransferase involved in cell wall biosynthesis
VAKVSVITPAYNVAPFVGATIESVIGQTMTDWEMLVVDDGSTDATAAVVEGYVAGDPRVQLLRQPNGGISNARNRALRTATADFIAILDADDLWEPAYLEAQLALFAKDPHIDIVTGNGWFLGGRRHGRPARPCPDTRPQPTLASMLADEEAIFIMSIMRRRVYETVGPFDEALRTNEDYDYWLRAAAAGFRFFRNDEPLGHYRRRIDSLSSSEVRMVSGILRVYEKTRVMLASRPAELRILESQMLRFQRELHAAEARAALSAGNASVAATHLSALYDQGGGFRMKIASVMARWTPGLLARVYQVHRARQEAAS